MADPSNVAALLAALTNQQQQQRGPGVQTPQNLLSSLQQTQMAQPGANNALAALQNLLANTQQNPQQPGVGSASSFALPQPTGSGALDLSNVKPTNSGTVSLQDAIARAKNFASERGVQPGAYRPPNQGGPGSRDFDGASRNFNQDSRSRSRSPGQRGAGFNPYRDERRNRNAFANSPRTRERSFSPPNRGNRRGSPRGFRERSPQGEGNITDHMMIDASLVGLIIGRRGETLKRVEEMSGARVQFVTDSKGEPERVCNITGPRAAVQSARQQIQTIISENSASSIRDDHRRPNHGHGHQQQQQQQQQQRFGGGGGGGPMPGAASPALQGGPQGGHHPVLKEGENSIQIMVPDKTVGLIIGRRGETIQDLQERSGCHINIVGESKSVNGYRPVNLIGTTEAATRAQALIMEIVDSDIRQPAAQQGGGGGGGGGGRQDRGPQNSGYGNQGGGGGGGDKNSETIRVPSEAVGMIIGKGGETIKEMQNSTGCRINVLSQSSPNEIEREISLSGSSDAINRAKQAIDDKVEVSRRQGQGGGQSKAPDYGSGAPSYQPDLSAYMGAAKSAAPSMGTSTDAANDPYQAYGGYQAYAQMYYAAILAQQQQQQQGGAADQRPPGT